MSAGIGLLTALCISSIVHLTTGLGEFQHAGQCDDGDEYCDPVAMAVANLTSLVRDNTYVMDLAVEEDAAKASRIQQEFSEQLQRLERFMPDDGHPWSVPSQVLLEAVKGVVRSRSNIIKDQMARHGKKEVWPAEVEVSANWMNSLLEKLLNSKLFRTHTPAGESAVRAALHQSVRMRLDSATRTLLHHVNSTWSGSADVASQATQLLPVALSVQSWHIAGELLSLSTRSRQRSDHIATLRTPSVLLASHASAWHTALGMCRHFPQSSLNLNTHPVGEPCASSEDCVIHRWLLTSLVNSSMSNPDSGVTNSRSALDSYCQAVSLSDGLAGPALPSPLGASDVERVNGRLSSDGGWKRGSYLFGSGETCDLPRYDAATMTTEMFNNLHELSLPALIVNATTFQDELRLLFTRENTQQLFVTTDLLVGHIPYGEVFGLYSGMATGQEMLEYLDSEWQKYPLTARTWERQTGRALQAEEPPLYIFDESVIQRKLNASGTGLPFTLPDFLPQRWKKQVHQFIWGSPGSGSPVHFHCPAINIMAFGRKRWTLYPPVGAHYSTVHPLHVRSRRASEKPLPRGLHCVQQPGEILFVPSHWAHSTVNIDQTIGVAVEFDLPFC